MPFWEQFKQLEIAETKGPGTQSANSLTGVELSLESFGLKLLKEESSAKLRQNVLISPLSIFVALAMTENGASGETKAGMRKALALPPDVSQEVVNESATALLKALESQGAADLTIANGLWIDLRSKISPDFAQVCQKIHDATTEILDLSQPSSAAIINNWVSERTKGKIPSIVTRDHIANAVAILTNAVYFKGNFYAPFRQEATKPGIFYLADGPEKIVPMMRGHFTGSYRSGSGFEAATLRYRNSGIALYLLLPARGKRPEDILTADSVQEMLAAQGSVELDLSVPRFTIDFSGRLNESLAQMGMSVAFQYPGADFSALGSPLFFLGAVMHKTRMEVDEKGTVAAAVTVQTVSLGSSLEHVKTKTLVFDRPFAVLLRDAKTGAIVFVGVVYDP